MGTTAELKRTPLFDSHLALGGRMVDFGGWEMPVQYSGILDEARAVRSRAGIFDVSHMGRVTFDGPGSAAFLDRVLSVNVPKVRVGRARYGVICNQAGGIIDDTLVYRRGEESYLLVPNASNSPAVLEWLGRWLPSSTGVQLKDVTSQLAMIALQGPAAQDILQAVTEHDLSTIRPFGSVDASVAGSQALVARTGYTGEDGFEVILPHEGVVELWNASCEKGAVPCGLGARDVLRLEAGLLLHGNDMDTSINPYEAGLDRFVDPDREGYVAGEALRAIRAAGAGRKLVGFEVVGRGIARHGYPILDGSKQIGEVTSGSPSPTLDRNIGMGYVPTGFAEPGSRLQVDVRGRAVDIEVVNLPFYSRSRG